MSAAASVLRVFPFMAIIVAIYNALVLLTTTPLDAIITRIGLPSGTECTLSLGDLLVIGAVLLLFVEVVGAARSRTSSIVNHGLSMLVFVVCVVEFLLVAGCGTSTFLIISLLTLLDVVAGYSIGIMTARRDVAFVQE